jgi:hypothetical protein
MTRETTKYGDGVTSGSMTFVPALMKISPPIQKLLEGRGADGQI